MDGDNLEAELRWRSASAVTTDWPGKTPSEPMYVGYAREFQRPASESAMLRRINRFIVYYLGAYFCGLDLEASHCNQRAAAAPSEHGGQRRPWPRLAGLQQSDWKRRLRFGWIPRALLVCFCLFQAGLFVAAYYQYRYDFDVLRLLELGRRHARTGGGGGGEELGLAIKSRMAETKLALDRLGSDYSHLTILAECFYLVIAVLALFMYLPLYVHHRFYEPFDKCHIVRDLLDRPRELARSRALVERQVAKFVESSRVFQANLIVFPDTSPRARQADAPVQPYALPSASRAAKRERELGQLVREMLASGALAPLYRLRSLVARRTLTEFCYHLSQTAFILAFNLILAGSFFSLADSERASRGESLSGELLLPAIIFGTLIIASPNMIVHPPLMFVFTSEYIQYIKQLRCMIRECIVLNSSLADQLGVRGNTLRAPPGAKKRDDDDDGGERTSAGAQFRRDLERTMNSNLILVLLHYKIFVAQLAPVRHSLGVKFLLALVLLFTVPLITRVHQPYLRKLYEGRLTDAQIRIFVTLLGSSVLLPINLLCVPVCHMFARCKCLYRDLASLMAHISEVKMCAAARDEARGRADIYCSHTQSCLQKELSDSKRLLEQLTVRACGISGTYTNLIKALLWFGLIAISIMAENSYSDDGGGCGGGGSSHEGRGELLSCLLSDPLGVYSSGLV